MPWSDTLTRFMFLGGSVAALMALTHQDEIDRALKANAEPTIYAAVEQTKHAQWGEANPTAYRDTHSTSPTCSSWDVSPVAMEAILDEMIRRGWRPPTQGEYVAGLYGMDSIEVLDPSAPLWVDSPRGNPLTNMPELPTEDSLSMETEIALPETTSAGNGAFAGGSAEDSSAQAGAGQAVDVTSEPVTAPAPAPAPMPAAPLLEPTAPTDSLPAPLPPSP